MYMFVGAYSGYSSNKIEESKQFYSEVLGLKLKEQMGGFGYEVGGQKVFVYPKDDHQPATFTVFSFVVEDITAAVDALVAKGVVFERYDSLPAPQDERGILRGKDAGYGPNIAWMRDPAGNILAVTEE